jgi:hypothetical protein
LPRTIEVSLLQKPAVASSVQSIIGGQVNGDQRTANNIQTVPQPQKMPVNGMAGPVNRIGGAMNGTHNRFCNCVPEPLVVH